MFRSGDDGYNTFRIPGVGSDGTNFVGNPSVVVDQRSGRVVVLATHKNGSDTEIAIDAGIGVDTSRVWLITSDDNGRT